MYESGNENNIDDVIEKNNKEIKQREDEAERVRLNTIHQMEINRENQAKKEKEEADKRDYLIKLSDALGITQHREEIDKLNTSVTYIAEKMKEDRQSINEILGILKNPTGTAIQTEKADPMQKIEALSQLIQPLAEAYKLFKSDTPQIQPLISQEVINEKMQKTFFDNLETGESINDFIKTSLKKTVTRKIVNQALSEIGNEASNHGPI